MYDDMSWKVGQAAAKCLCAVIATRHEMLTDFHKVVSISLIARFKGGVPINFYVPYFKRWGKHEL